jgi:hypothetical protein
MIFKIFWPKNLAKNWRFLLKTKLNYAKIVIIILVFDKNANFLAENWQKSQKIVIITSTPGIVFACLFSQSFNHCIMSCEFLW